MRIDYVEMGRNGNEKSHSRSTVLGICENKNGNKFIGMRVEGLATL